MTASPDSYEDRMSDRCDPRDSLSIVVAPAAARGEVTVRVRGELDLASAQALQQTLTSVVDGGAVDVVLDVTDVSFCDVAGLDVILRARSLLSSRGGRLRLVGPCRALQTMIRVLALADHVPVTAGDSGHVPDRAGPDLVDGGERQS